MTEREWAGFSAAFGVVCFSLGRSVERHITPAIIRWLRTRGIGV